MYVEELNIQSDPEKVEHARVLILSVPLCVQICT